MRDLNVAVWGLGSHAIKNILPAIHKCQGIILYGICSRNVEKIDRISIEWNCKKWVYPEEMLEDDNVDVVYLSTPIGLHYEHGKLVLSAFKHLWCEKPLTQNNTKTLELLDISKKNQCVIAEAFMYLYHPQFLYLKEIVDSEDLGQIKAINCRFGIPPLKVPGFRDDAGLGGGAFLDVGSYMVSVVVSLFPNDEPEILYSKINKDKASDLDISGMCILKLFSDTILTLDWAINISYRNEIDFWGEKSSLFTQKIFSKPEEYIPVFKFSSQTGYNSEVYGIASNHFITMLSNFRDLIYKVSDAEYQRQIIFKRSVLMDKLYTMGIS